MSMGNAPPNSFMPRILKPLKAEATAGKRSMPKLVLEDKNMQVFFKQDDQFDQPLVEIRCKILTNDCNFPTTPESLIFSIMWAKMLDESHRELNYMAQLAGIEPGIAPTPDHILFTLSSYNDSV